jgi:prepilin-type N-terminal cleavage/methylation domain-containing protein
MEKLGRQFFGRMKNAFTLLELLVALAVLSLLIVMLMSMVDNGAKLWRENENRVEAYREARAALGMIERDLRNAIAMNDTNFIRINAEAFPKLLETDVQKNTNGGSAIFFLAAQPAAAQDSAANKGDICEVGYFVGYGNSSAGPVVSGGGKSMNLYRYFRSSDGTFSNLTNSSSSLFTNVTITGAESDLLARNIKSFRLIPYHLDAAGDCVPYNPTTYGAMPDLLEVSITALNQDVSRKLSSVAAWTNSSSSLTNVTGAAEQRFTTRIRLHDKL